MANGKTNKRKPDQAGVLFVRCPLSLPAAIERAAEREMTTLSGYVRTAVIKQLRRDGFDPSEATQ